MTTFNPDASSVFDTPSTLFTPDERRPADERRQPVAEPEHVMFDPATGEIIEDQPEVDDATAGRILDALAAHAAVADPLVLHIGPHADIDAYSANLRGAIRARIDAGYNALVSARPDAPIDVAVAPELRWLTATHDTLDTVGRVFADAIKDVKSITGDVIQEARPERELHKVGGTASVRVARVEGEEGTVKASVTQPTKAFAELPAILDVLVADMLAQVDAAGWSEEQVAAYADGARDALARAQEITNPWGVKTSVLDKWLPLLPDALAARLRAAYGRKVHGNPTVSFGS